MRVFLGKEMPAVLISFMVFFAGLLLFTPVGEDYGSFCYINLPGKQFCDYPYLDTYYLGIVGINAILGQIYDLWPGINWYLIFLLLTDFLGLWLILREIRKIMALRSYDYRMTVILQILFGLFYLDNVMVLSHSRVSLVLAGIGLYYLLFTDRPGILRYLFYYLVFILGVLIRPEGGMGSILFIGGGFLIYKFDLKTLITRLALPAMFTALLWGGFALDEHCTSDFVKKVEPEVEYKMMARRVVPLAAMQTAEDSIKYQAARMGIWFDFKTMTPEYLRSIQLSTFDLNMNQVTDQKLARPHSFHIGASLGIQHVIDVMFHTGTFYLDYLFAPVIILVFFTLSLSSGMYRLAWRIAIYSMYTFLLFFAIDYNGFLLGERHFMGFEVVALVIILYFYFSETKPATYNKGQLALASVAIAVSLAYTLYYYKQTNNESASELNQHLTEMAALERCYQGRLVVLTNDSYTLFDQKISLKTHNYDKNKYILFDVFTYSLTPNYLDYLHRQCQCDPSDPVAFYRWLSCERALYIVTPKRQQLTEKYMKLIRHLDLSLSRPEDICADLDSGSVDFLLRSVVLK